LPSLKFASLNEAGHQEVHVLDAGMDVGLDGCDVAHLHLGAGRWHELHHADGADVAARRLVEPRFLVALRGEHERIERVALAIAAEQREHRLEPLPVRRPSRVLICLTRFVACASR
jgi:hypothetical protein